MKSGGKNVGFEMAKVREDVQFSIEDFSHPVAVIELDGTIAEVNRQFKRVFGFEEKRNIEEVIDQAPLREWKSYLGEAERKRRITVNNMKVLIKDYGQCTVKISLLFCPIDRQICILFNLPSSLKLSKENYHSIAFQESEYLMIVVNPEGYIEDINDLAIDFFELPSDHFIGMKGEKLFEFFSGEQSKINTFKQEIVGEGRAEIVQQYIHSSGEVKYYKIKAFYDKNSCFFLMRITDYTERFLLKQGYAEKGSLLAIGQLAASIAHEIRNPMTTLKGFTQLLKATATEETLKYLMVIDDEIHRMESILSEMLLLSKPATKEKKVILFKQLILDIISVIQPKAICEGVTIIQKGDFNAESFIYGNEGKLKQVLLNLLKNGLESMESGGTLTITITYEENGRLVLNIEDTGQGMNQHQLDQIFSPYFTTKVHGTGLGLPFVLKTIEDHGGKIDVSSTPHVGSNFMLSFPVVQNEVEEVLSTSILVN